MARKVLSDAEKLRRRRKRRKPVWPRGQESEHFISITFDYKVFGRPDQDMASAQQVKRILQTGLEESLEVSMIDEEGNVIPIPDREYKKVEGG